MQRLQALFEAGSAKTLPEDPDVASEYEDRLKHLSLLAGNSNPELFKGIAAYLGVNLTKLDLGKFANSEINVRILDNVRRKDVVIMQTGAVSAETGYSVNDYLMETMLMINACRLSSANEIILLMPCFPYARQDKKDASRVPISGRIVADMLEMAGVSRIIFLDLHASQISGFFSIPVDNLYAVNVLATHLLKNYLTKDRERYLLVSPDNGGTKRIENLGSKVDLMTATMHKTRDYDKKNTVMETKLSGDVDSVKGKICFLVDDMCDTAGTICKAGETLMKHGAEYVIIMVVHGLFNGPALERLNNADYIKKVICTNSLPQLENKKKCPKIEVIDVGALLGEVVNRLQTGESISELFN